MRRARTLMTMDFQSTTCLRMTGHYHMLYGGTHAKERKCTYKVKHHFYRQTLAQAPAHIFYATSPAYLY